MGSSWPRAYFGQRGRGSGWPEVTVRAVLPPGDQRVFCGQVELVEPTGFTIVSDIDDTIKLTEVTNRSAMLRNTFLESFRPVPQMAEVFRGWAAEAGARVCYLSASPWQLFTPLSEFIQTNQFPAGALLLREFRWKDESFFNLFTRPDVYKTGAIEDLLRRFPKRRLYWWAMRASVTRKSTPNSRGSTPNGSRAFSSGI